MTRTNDLGRDPIGPLLLRLAVPTMTAQLVNALYNIVDRIYIGQIPETGALALTALGVCFPVLMLVAALAALIGIGGGARAAIHLGEENRARAARILGSCALALFLLAVFFTVLLQLLRVKLLYLFGASGDTIGYADSYLHVYLYGSVFVLFSLGLNAFISAQGFTRVSMATVLLGAVCNIILDPILIYGFGMGVSGAALATVLSQAVSAIWVIVFLCGSRTKIRLSRRDLRLDWACLAPVLALGVSPFVMQSSESLLNIAFNVSLQRYGGDLAGGAMTIASSVTQIGWMLLQGLTQGAQP
ncbi:MAG: MATE family efflux transporter, partial [Oscillospiraceae bacterium]|nr:MATE family efflux transporter [Oscillospiraceae bacterium]